MGIVKDQMLYKNLLAITVIILTVLTCSVQSVQAESPTRASMSANPPSDNKIVITPFDYEGVQLLDGPLKVQFDRVKDFYLSLPNNNILYGFRKRAGMYAPGREIGGAYSNTALTFGQWLGAFARMYKVTGDPDIRNKAMYIMDEWARTIEDDGYFLNTEEKLGHPHYVYDKFVQGLVDMYEYVGCERAKRCLDKITGWAEKNLDRSNPYALPTEWYTLSENLYRAYELTGDKRYFDFAKVWEYTDYWGAFAKDNNVFELLKKIDRDNKGYHAYSHVNTFSSAAMAYKVTGKRHYLDTIVNAYKFLKNTQLFATGGYGPEEQLIVPEGLPETLLPVYNGKWDSDLVFHFETACGSWAGFKLSRYLMEFTGQAKYGDWAERLVYNGIGAQPQMNKMGMIMYGSRYHLCGAQKTLTTTWFCCQGTRPLDVTDYHNLIYYKDNKNLYVNLFVPSQVQWHGPDGTVKVIQKTQYPEDETVCFEIQPKKPESRFGLKFRIPMWAHKGVEVMINGTPTEIKTIPGEWACIKRKWHCNDTVTLKFDLSPRIEPLPGYVSPVAVMCGPAVMVKSTARWSNEFIPTKKNLRFPADWLTGRGGRIRYSFSPSMKAPVNRGSRLRSNEVFRPFYDIKPGEFYRMYFERDGQKIIPSEKLSFNGVWKSEDKLHYTEEPGSSFEGKFQGSTVVWEGLRTKEGGKAEICIDGKKVAEVDQYGYTFKGRIDQHKIPFRWSITDLGGGEHEIKVSVLSEKNPKSEATEINIRRLTVY
ncbi:beta-L-arabinofuranosidase domain-containing protein [Sedimentisphaera salicampi]|uniref:Non-reducing end beta-L-arabinofuranosidase n=1 Tax=Sedimentisphaera salicampi TaxID=1941349 RepID=A0A1W6LK63_9BACT|nr:beta-L-arabinofuranosidase domain-containing protein [Sedimentisphaera salicampi]ARN56167.1 hypothetical protein STSP1_00540 [Sedimentisphaera salicampi]OXU15745.1 hypothetical protein SMSP1_00534 [Sedimentisphaera salicampi]